MSFVDQITDFLDRSSMDNCQLPAENQVDKNGAIKITWEKPKKSNITPEHLETSRVVPQTWHSLCKSGITLSDPTPGNRQWQQQCHLSALTALPQSPDPALRCPVYSKLCRPRIGLYSHLQWYHRKKIISPTLHPTPKLKTYSSSLVMNGLDGIRGYKDTPQQS